MMGLIEKYQLHPQIWMIAPAAEAESQEKRVEINAPGAVAVREGSASDSDASWRSTIMAVGRANPKT